MEEEIAAPTTDPASLGLDGSGEDEAAAATTDRAPPGLDAPSLDGHGEDEAAAAITDRAPPGLDAPSLDGHGEDEAAAATADRAPLGLEALSPDGHGEDCQPASCGAGASSSSAASASGQAKLLRPRTKDRGDASSETGGRTKRWLLVWCNSSCFKPEGNELRQSLSEVARARGAALICLKSHARIDCWLAERRANEAAGAEGKKARRPFVLLITELWMALKCAELFAQEAAPNHPMATALVCGSPAEMVSASVWVHQGAPAQLRPILLHAEIDAAVANIASVGAIVDQQQGLLSWGLFDPSFPVDAARIASADPRGLAADDVALPAPRQRGDEDRTADQADQGLLSRGLFDPSIPAYVERIACTDTVGLAADNVALPARRQRGDEEEVCEWDDRPPERVAGGRELERRGCPLCCMLRWPEELSGLPERPSGGGIDCPQCGARAVVWSV